MSKVDWVVACALALALLGLYGANGEVLPGKDAVPNVYLTEQVLDEGRLSFSPSRTPWLFGWELSATPGQPARLLDLKTPVGDREAASLYAEGLLVPHPPYYLARSVRWEPTRTGLSKVDSSHVEPVYVPVPGAGAGLSGAVVLAPLRLLAGPLKRHPRLLWFGTKFAASLFTAASAALVFLAARHWLAGWPAALLAVAYGAGTSAWSTASQALWQHGPNEFYLALGVIGLVRGGRRAALLAGTAFALATVCRPTSGLFAIASAAWLLFFEDRRAFLAFVAGGAPVALGLAAYNTYYLGSPVSFGQAAVAPIIALAKTGSSDVWSTPLLAGLAGLLVSPSRGLLVFSPWLALGVAGGIRAFSCGAFRALRPLAMAALGVLAVQAMFFDWWGGWAFGYRPIVDLSPILAVLAVPLVGWVLATRLRRAVVAALVAWSVFVQVVGAIAYDVKGWNSRHVYRVALASGVSDFDAADLAAALARGGRVLKEEWRDVDRPAYRHRLWSLADNEISYYVGRMGRCVRSKAEGGSDWLTSWELTPTR